MKKHLFYLLITLFSIQISHAQCDNVTSPGSIAANQIVCADNPDPAIILNVELPSGGSGDLEFLWISTTLDPNSSTAVWFPIDGSSEDSYNPEPISQTTYYRRCSRRTGCSEYLGESNIITVEYADECMNTCDFFKVTIMSISPANCGAENGTVNLSIVAGTLPLSYNLNGEILTELPNNYAAGSYDLSVTDAEGCTDEISFVIEGEVNTVAVVGEIINPTCQTNNGSINLSISGGTGNYTANWNDDNTNINRTNLSDGTYSVTITDENGCTAENSFTLTMIDSDLAINLNVTNATCSNDDGSAEVIIEGGTAPYSIQLDGNPVTEISNLAPGSYLVTVTDANGCSQNTELIIQGTESIITVLGSITHPICSANNGEIDIEVNGNNGSITIDWDFNGSNMGSQENLGPGVYEVTVTDENGCTGSTSFTLIAEDSNLSLDVTTVDALCGGTGSANLEITNGTEPYTTTISGNNTNELDALPAGIYEVIVTDVNGCTAASSFTINEIGSDIEITGTTTNPICTNNSGSISLDITGGTGAVSVLWEDDSTDANRVGLIEGTYTVTATDENGCTGSTSFTLSTDESDLDLNLTLTDVSCNGGNDGSATTEIIGGTAPYTLTLDGTEVTDISNLPAGEYTAKAIDAAGCSVAVSFNIAQAPLLIVEANTQNPSCGLDNGSIELTLSGGTGEYTVVWDDNLSNDLIRNNLAAGTYSLSVKDENDCTITTQFTLTDENSNLSTELTINNIACNGEANGSVDVNINSGTPPYLFTLNGGIVLDLNNLSAGDYTLETTDISGCSTTDEFTISEPAAIEIEASATNPNCNGANGSITLELTGGTPNGNGDYTIEWNTGNGNNLSAGDYSVTITDANGCSATAAFALTSIDSDLDAVILTSPVNCYNAEDGTANITVTGGTEPYSYLLNGEAISELPLLYAAGEYTLVITDSNGCSSSEKIYSIESPDALAISATINNTTCTSAGSIDLSITGGIAPYEYLWSNNETSQDLNGIPAGDYFVTVTDLNGCVITNAEPYTVINEGGDSFTFAISTTAVSCFGGMDGAVTVNVDGGTEPYSYTLNGMNMDNLPTNLVEGDYTLSVQDVNGCSASGETTFSISQPVAAISFTGLVQNNSCESELGSIALTVSGGTFPYSFLWSNNGETQNLSNVAFGTYSVTITDANGCSVNNNAAPFVLAEIPELSLYSTTSSTTCGDENGNIAITVSQGTPPYQIVWNDGLTDVVLRSDLTGGNYGVTVTDANNCSVSEEFAIATSIELTVNITPVSASCNGMDDGEINMSFAGGTPPFTYILNGQSYNDLPSTLPADDYQLQVFDAIGCSDLVEFAVGEPDEIIYLAEQTDATCPGDSVTVEFSAVQGGSGSYTYLWSDDVTTLDRDDLTDGIYFLTITDTNGCTAVSEPFVATVPDEIIISADEGDFQNVSCYGEEDGAVDISVTGGTPPYSYYWSNGATTEDIDNLAPGDYLLQLADANGCMTLFLAVISNPQELNATSIVTDASCMEFDGVASIWPTGGTQPYFFQWDNGGMNAEETNLAPGPYKITVSDFGGCEIVINLDVEEMDCLQSETGEEFSFVMNELSPNLTNNSVELHWMTEAEAVESFFIIQHSQDGNTFTDVSGLLPGQGATQTQNEYYNTCSEMAMGTHFFRIRYVDAFGNLRTSETMSTQLIPESETEFSVFPNPTIDDFRINFLLPLDAPAKVQIVNSQAVILENITAPTGSLHQFIDLSKYNPGVYFVVVEKEGLRRLTKRIVKM